MYPVSGQKLIAMREGLKSSDPVVKAAARGKLVTSLQLAGLFLIWF